MESGIVAILKADAAIIAIVGAGDDSRIYPEFVPQEVAMPQIVYRRLNNTPNDTKDGVSKLDVINIDVDVWSDTEGEMRNLAGLIRVALDRYTGIIAGINFQSIRFVNDFTGHEEDNRRKHMTQQYSVRQLLT